MPGIMEFLDKVVRCPFTQRQLPPMVQRCRTCSLSPVVLGRFFSCRTFGGRCPCCAVAGAFGPDNAEHCLEVPQMQFCALWRRCVHAVTSSRQSREVLRFSHRQCRDDLRRAFLQHFSASVQQDVEAQGWWRCRESDSKVFCHLNSLHALAHVDRDICHTPRPHHHKHHTTTTTTTPPPPQPQPPPPQQQPPHSATSALGDPCLRVSPFICRALAAGRMMAGRDGSGAAKRRRERRQWHRHERLTVQMALCEALPRCTSGGER